MARRSGFKLPGVTSYVDRVKNVVAQEAAEFIVRELQEEGPAYTGEFRNAWKIVSGVGKRIPATKDSSYNETERRAFGNRSPEAREDIKAPKFAGRKDNGYSIGNEMEYRDYALDLIPGRFSEDKINTADKDWYVRFVEGGGLKNAIEAATLKAAKSPKIRGFPDKGRI